MACSGAVNSRQWTHRAVTIMRLSSACSNSWTPWRICLQMVIGTPCRTGYPTQQPEFDVETQLGCPVRVHLWQGGHRRCLFRARLAMLQAERKPTT